jgi:hypothetical protein
MKMKTKTSSVVPSVVALAFGTVSAVALAQAPKPAAAPAAPAAAKPAAAMPPAPIAPAAAPAAAAPAIPKPAPEMDQLKIFEGSWRCDGKVPAGPLGPEQSYKATFKVKKDLDGFWLAADYEQKKSKAHPVPIKAKGFFTWEAGEKKFVFAGVDNLGGMAHETSTGWEGDKLVLSGPAVAMGQKTEFRETFTKKGDKELVWMGEMKSGKDWVVVGNDTCKKGGAAPAAAAP